MPRPSIPSRRLAHARHRLRSPRLRRQEGYAALLVCLVAPVILAMIGLAIDFGTMAYHRAKVQAAADAAAIAAVKNQALWHVPVPTKFWGFIPVDGFFVNGIHLNNLGWAGEPLEPVQAIAAANAHAGVPIALTQNRYVPGWNVVSPFHYVQMETAAEVPLHFSRLWGVERRTVRARSCAIAWVRLDYWGHKWWTDKTAQAFTGSPPLNYYRPVSCVPGLSGAGDFWDMANVLAPVMAQLAGGEQTAGLDQGLRDSEGWQTFTGTMWNGQGAAGLENGQFPWNMVSRTGQQAGERFQQYLADNLEQCRAGLEQEAAARLAEYQAAHERWTTEELPAWLLENGHKPEGERDWASYPPEPQPPTALTPQTIMDACGR